MLFSHGPVLSEWCLPAALQLFQPRGTLSWEVLTRFIPAMQLLWPFVLFFGALAVPSIHDDTTCTIPESQFLVSITARKNIIYVYIYMFEIVPNCLNIFLM